MGFTIGKHLEVGQQVAADGAAQVEQAARVESRVARRAGIWAIDLATPPPRARKVKPPANTAVPWWYRAPAATSSGPELRMKTARHQMNVQLLHVLRDGDRRDQGAAIRLRAWRAAPPVARSCRPPTSFGRSRSICGRTEDQVISCAVVAQGAPGAKIRVRQHRPPHLDAHCAARACGAQRRSARPRARRRARMARPCPP